MFLGGADGDVARSIHRQPPDQENKAADALAEPTLLRTVFAERKNSFIDLSR